MSRESIHAKSKLDRPRITNDAYPKNGFSHTSSEASRVLRFCASEGRTTGMKIKMNTLEETMCAGMTQLFQRTYREIYEYWVGNCSDRRHKRLGIKDDILR